MIKKQEKGITLVVLIITIILFLILCGLTFEFTLNGKEINATKNVANQSEQQMNTQEEMLNEIKNLI